jgi:glucosamine 6-phosphate synthetase-like amidotransferase/phosphosugar isomerase protein
MGYKIDRATEGYKFMWDIHQNPVRAMLLHHRIPTSSDNKLKQTHPFLVDNGSLQFKYLLVHNGVIRNDDELKKEHESLGFIYTTENGIKFNDSECVAIEVARFIEGQIDIVGTKGSNAFMCLQINKKTEKVTQIFFGRNEGNPLNMSKTRNKMIVSSAGPGVEVKPFKLYGCKLDAEMKLSKKTMKFAIDPPTTYVASVSRTLPGIKESKMLNREWDNWNRDEDYGDYAHYKKGYVKPTEEELEDEEVTAVQEEIEQSTVVIQEDLDGFLDLLYDNVSAEYLDEKDIEIVTESIRKELTDLMNKVKEIQMENALTKETEVEQKGKTMQTIGY